MVQQFRTLRVAFVSTNSVTQGEQVGLLWGEILTRYRCHIQFAHRTFRWSNEARGNAAVYCIIVGYGADKLPSPRLFDYPTPRSAPQEIPAKSINAYLVDGPEVVVVKRSKPLSNVPPMIFGSMPNDGGHFILSEEEKETIVAAEPEAAQFIRRYTGGDDFINNKVRYCLWLESASPSQLQKMPQVMARVKQVQQVRLASTRGTTKALAAFPTLFGEVRQPKSEYLLVPRVSSERRKYIPIGFMPAEIVGNDQIMLVPNATPYLFGILTSEMHMAWVKQVCGRLKSDFRYSGTLVYNNYPFPSAPTEAQRQAVAVAAEAVLAARAAFPTESLAALYDPSTMPPALARAHQALDRAVDRCYRPQPFSTELARLEFLFGLYQQLSAPVLGTTPKKARASRS